MKTCAGCEKLITEEETRKGHHLVNYSGHPKGLTYIRHKDDKTYIFCHECFENNTPAKVK